MGVFLMDNVQHILNDLDDEFLDEFSQNTTAVLDDIERYLMNIHLYPSDTERMDLILQLVQQIKQNCRLTFLDPLIGYVQAFENLLTEVQEKRIFIDKLLSEFLLLVFDEIRTSCQNVAKMRTLDHALLDHLHDNINALIGTPYKQFDEELRRVIPHFISGENPDFEFSALEVREVISEEPNVFIEGDLAFFADLASTVDSRSRFWEGRSKRVLNISNQINEQLAEKVDAAQLAAAVYIHDFGMSLLEDALLFKKSKYDFLEMMLIQQHPMQGYELLRRIPSWEEAATMVRQHHERPDGKGYPNALKRDDICLGARILAVADAFCSITSKRSDREYKKSVFRAFSEINKQSGAQFDEVVVEAFNEILRSIDN